MKTDPSNFAASVHPALSRLRFWHSKNRIPYVQQMEMADCGAACINMVLGYYGREISLREVRDVFGGTAEGLNALVILRAGEHFGLRGRGIKAEIESIKHLPPASILHWKFSHFVVFDRVTRQGVWVVDPAVGRRLISWGAFARNYTGIALILEPSDAFKPATKGQNPVWPYVRQIVGQRKLFPRVVAMSLLIQVLALALPFLTGIMVDRIIPQADLSLLWVIAGGLGAAVIFNFLAQLVRASLLLHLRTQLDVQCTVSFLEHLVRLPFGFFQQRTTGDLINRINSNTQIRETLSTGTLSGLLDGSLAVAYLGLVFLISTWLGLLVLALMSVRIVVYLVSRKRYRDLMAEQLETRAGLQAFQVEMLHGISTLKLMGAEGRSLERWTHAFVDDLNVGLVRGRVEAWVDSLLNTLGMASPLLIMTSGALLVFEERLSLGEMLAATALATSFFTPFSNLIDLSLRLQTLRGYLDRVQDVFETNPEQDRKKVSKLSTLKGGVKLESVSFRYGPLSTFALEEISLEVEPGGFVAIVGPTGSGKSTLANLMVGLYLPTSGCIYFDGKNLLDLDFTSVRRQFGVVAQNNHLFAMSIRNNIALADPTLPLDEVVRAARLAHVHEDIMAMPMGYDAAVAEGGRLLSGGQAQRVAIARALVTRPPILLLDEATSAVDTVTEDRIKRDLQKLRCTRIVIAHRLSTVMDADLIYVLDQGRILDRGTHEELMEQCPLYQNLASVQLRRASAETA